jgi:hypothetical protein
MIQRYIIGYFPARYQFFKKKGSKKLEIVLIWE